MQQPAQEGTGGSGGREGPTMQIGGAIGSLVGRYLKVPVRERRVLLIAGVAGGMAAVFRTPLGAALRVLSQESRDQRMSMAEKKAAALPPVLTVPMILFFLPGLFAAILTPAIIQINSWN